MKQIRKGFFETNSSSTHAISLGVCDKALFTSMLPIQNNTLKLTGGIFGWKFDKYSDAKTKLQYLVTWIVTRCSVYEVFAKIKDEVLSEGLLKDPYYQKLCKVIREYCGDCEITPPSAEAATEYNIWGEIGYIDHASMDVAAAVMESEEDIACFIFNPNSILMTGNDNSLMKWDKEGNLVEME